MLFNKVNLRLFFNQTCALCQLHPCETSGLCEACHADLPWLLNPCQHCALPLGPSQGLCSTCRQHDSAYDRIRAAFHYQFPLNSLIPNIKYQHNPVALGWLSEVFARWLGSDLESPPQALVYVPMRPWRALLRGFNQSELLCQALSQKLCIPVLEGAVQKTRSTPRQMTLNAEQRRQNLCNAFFAQGPLPRHVALIDDICTTGSTAQAIALALKNAGCEVVEVWVLARTPDPRHFEAPEP